MRKGDRCFVGKTGVALVCTAAESAKRAGNFFLANHHGGDISKKVKSLFSAIKCAGLDVAGTR